MKPIPFVVAQHAGSSAILWLRREAAVTQPHYALPDLARLDGRLEANLDGLRIAGQAGWEAVEYELGRWREPGELFGAAFFALDSGDEGRIQHVLSAALSSAELSRAFVSALGWLPIDRVETDLGRFQAHSSVAFRRIGLAAATVHRRDPGRALLDGLEDADTSLRARSLRAAGELARTDLLPFITTWLASADAEVRLSAAWSAALLGADSAAVEVLKTIVENCAAGCQRALPLALLRLEIAEAAHWTRRLQGDPKLARTAARAAGLVGAPDFVVELIERMRTPALARLAGEAFTMITGVDIAYQSLDRPRPQGFESGPNDDPADENVAMDPDENLPWPDRDKIAAWWKRHETDFTPGTRYLLGKPITEEWLEHVLRHGYQRQRAAAALELAIRRPGTPLFEVRAPGFRQQELLS